VPDELSSIEGLADKHLRALTRQGVTDLRGLAQADQRAIYQAMANLRPRPTLEQIARWQDEARSRLAESGPDAREWQTVASFVVVFSQRQVDDAWERHIGAERTEVEPERHPEVWSGWECEPVCAWMLGQLPATAPAVPSAPAPSAPAPSAPAEPREPPEPSEPPPAPASRSQLRIDSAALIDAAGRTEVVTAGALAANPRTELVAPVRVVFAVGGAPPGTPLQAVARIRHPDGPGWNPRDPVVLAGPGQVEFDLTPVPAGDHVLALIAWAPDATAKPVSVTLPSVTIRPEPG
jgi:hypothetical protein